MLISLVLTADCRVVICTIFRYYLIFLVLHRGQAAQLIIMFFWTKMVSVLMHCRPWLIIFATRKLHWWCFLNLHKICTILPWLTFFCHIYWCLTCSQVCPVHSFSLYRWALMQLLQITVTVCSSVKISLDFYVFFRLCLKIVSAFRIE